MDGIPDGGKGAERSGAGWGKDGREEYFVVDGSGEVMERDGRVFGVREGFLVSEMGSSVIVMSLIRVEGTRTGPCSASTCLSSNMVSNSFSRFSISWRSSR